MDLPASSYRRLVRVIVWLSLTIVLIDALSAYASQTLGWHPAGWVYWISVLVYFVAGWLGYGCGGLVLGALTSVVVAIADGLAGTYLVWLILAETSGSPHPGLPNLAPMLAISVLIALAVGLLGVAAATLVRRRRGRAT